jgi:hypothetical protein
MRGGDRRAHQRTRAAGIHRHIAVPRQSAKAQRIASGFVERQVSRDRDYTEDLQFVAGSECQQYGDGIIEAGVRIDDDPAQDYSSGTPALRRPAK